MQKETEPRLFGIEHSNRDFTQLDSWGKNQFNSSFPAALACYMDHRKIKPVYLILDSSLEVQHKEISVEDVFGIEPDSPDLYFAFERDFPPYQKFIIGRLPRTDLVIIDSKKDNCLRRFEIKLTALPDNSTCEYADDQFGCEIVVRPGCIVYLAVSIMEIYEDKPKDLALLLEPACGRVSDWVDAEEILRLLPSMIHAIDNVLQENIDQQSPLVIQPVWKTEGKSAKLADNCLDTFVWSNYAFTRLFMNVARGEVERQSLRISRHMRTVVWLARMLYDFAISGRTDCAKIIDEISLSTKNDKAFAVSGRVTHPYMSSSILSKPRVLKTEIKNIILGGGQNYLSPERRFDAVIKNSPGLFD